MYFRVIPETDFWVEEFDPERDCHVCVDQGGTRHFLDLTIDQNRDPESLVGKIITCEHLQPYISIAIGVQIVDQKDAT